MTVSVTKEVAYAVIGLPGGVSTSKVNAYVILGPTPAGGGAGGSAQNSIVRVWSYSLDGHDFYCVRLGTNETLVYDLTTGQWSHWASPDVTYWRAHIGNNWVGMGATTVAHGYGSDVVAGDDTTGTLWILDPTAGVDDNTTTGTTPFLRKILGGVTLRSRDVQQCNAVEITMSLGNPVLVGADVTLKTSDDYGNTWTNQGTVTITPGDYSQVVEFRSLGLIRQPGRLFEISDSGAAVRISGADMR